MKDNGTVIIASEKQTVFVVSIMEAETKKCTCQPASYHESTPGAMTEKRWDTKVNPSPSIRQKALVGPKIYSSNRDWKRHCASYILPVQLTSLARYEACFTGRTLKILLY